MSEILNLKPERVWYYFNEICKIPRPSKKEERIAAWLVNFGKANNLETLTDKAGNVLIRKPATKGKECTKTVVLQSHIDMVCEKNASTVHDFEKDPIVPVIDGEWVKAKGTTLGADDGIGVAAQLAILEAVNISHGPIECLFTVNEETGLTGAFALKPDFLTGRILLNLDSEDEGQLFIGCAGGKGTSISFSYKKESVPENISAFKVFVTG
ncbi:MAG: M28 family peptidase, partial [Bacteroidales bacterium]